MIVRNKRFRSASRLISSTSWMGTTIDWMGTTIDVDERGALIGVPRAFDLCRVCNGDGERESLWPGQTELMAESEDVPPKARSGSTENRRFAGPIVSKCEPFCYPARASDDS